MRPIHALAAAAVAVFGLALAAPAAAAPAGGAGVMLVDDRDDRWRGPGAGKQARDDHDRHRGGEHRRWGDRGWEDHGWDRRHKHGGDRDWRGSDRHRGWKRGHDWRYGKGYRSWDRDWHDHNHDHWKKKKHWNKKPWGWYPRRHPRAHQWIGRHFPYGRFSVIRDYGHYRLPPPRHGYFYARIDDDIFLVAEATRRVVDAWVLLGVGR